MSVIAQIGDFDTGVTLRKEKDLRGTEEQQSEQDIDYLRFLQFYHTLILGAIFFQLLCMGQYKGHGVEGRKAAQIS